MLQVTLAYKYVVIAAMVSQINHYAPRMHLPIEVPVKEQDVRFLHVSTPIDLPSLQECGGRLQIKNYSFTFCNDWHNIYNMDEHGYTSMGIPMGPKESANSGMERASRMKYVVSTNDVYRMATNWIVALDIDLKKMEAVYPPRIDQGMFHSNRGLVPSPVITVEWKNQKIGYDPAGVTVEISAVSGEFLKLRDGNGAFSKRKHPLIKDLKKLLAISDEEFLRYTEQERRKLVEQFAGVKDEQGSTTNTQAAICDKLFLWQGPANPNTR